nr:aldo/keto reductase [Paenibacillus sacheonensis]
MGLGGAPLGGGFENTTEAEMERTVHEAIDLGITFIDTAPLYGSGKSEERIGNALRGGRREKVVLSTKAVRADLPHDYASTIASVEGSLKRLRTDYVDLLQIHDLEKQPYELIMNETLPALQKLRSDGKIRNIGFSTRVLPLMKRYMETDQFDAIQFYARYMLVDFSAADEILPLARAKNMGVINGSVLGMGLLAESPAEFLGQDMIDAAAERMEKLKFLRRTEPKGLIEPGYRFSLQNPDIHVTLTGAATSSFIRANAAFCDGQGLDPKDHERVLQLFKGAPSLFK